jgi:hypothetical protein
MNTNPTKMTLLTTGNPKIAKGTVLGYLTNILHLAPYKLSGRNVCPMATAGCAAACLNTAGRGGIIKKGETTNQIQIARLARTDFFFNDREAFMGKLVKEITNAIKLAEKHELTPVFRLNGTSDIRWETIAVGGFRNVMEMFPNVQFYDYTKIANRRDLPANYHLTFSLAESNLEDALLALAHGMNVAAVFRTVPDTFLGVSVIDGDATDLRFLDKRGVVVGLKAKGKAKKDTSGFVY